MYLSLSKLAVEGPGCAWLPYFGGPLLGLLAFWEFDAAVCLKYIIYLLAPTPLEAYRDTSNFFRRAAFFLSISLGRVVVPSPKIVINRSRTYEKLLCKGEPDLFYKHMQLITVRTFRKGLCHQWSIPLENRYSLICCHKATQ